MEDIEMDIETGAFERINVPPILESRRSTVLHDFETVNLTDHVASVIVQTWPHTGCPPFLSDLQQREPRRSLCSFCSHHLFVL